MGNIPLQSLGLRDEEYALVQTLLLLPRGLLLVAGAPRSGRTTTLRALSNHSMSRASDGKHFHLTALDQISDGEALTHALEVAEASLVIGVIDGHDTAEAIANVLRMGAAPQLLSTRLEAVVAQQLVNGICPKCREAYRPDEEELMEFGLIHDDVEGKIFHHGRGCSACQGTGNAGREALFEIMIATEQVQWVILQSHQSGQFVEGLRSIARMQGMRILRESALLAIFDGRIAIRNVVE